MSDYSLSGKKHNADLYHTYSCILEDGIQVNDFIAEVPVQILSIHEIICKLNSCDRLKGIFICKWGFI